MPGPRQAAAQSTSQGSCHTTRVLTVAFGCRCFCPTQPRGPGTEQAAGRLAPGHTVGPMAARSPWSVCWMRLSSSTDSDSASLGHPRCLLSASRASREGLCPFPSGAPREAVFSSCDSYGKAGRMRAGICPSPEPGPACDEGAVARLRPRASSQPPQTPASQPLPVGQLQDRLGWIYQQQKHLRSFIFHA